MDANKIYKLVKNIDSNSEVRLIVNIFEKLINFTVLESGNAWEGTADENELEHQAERLKISMCDYLKNLKSYLQDDPSASKVVYSFKDGLFVLYYEVDGRKINFFTCSFSKVSFPEIIGKLLDEVYLENDNLSKRLINLKKENTTISKEKYEYERKLTEFINRKQIDDERMFKKFTLVLNEKKMQIQHLNELLEAFKQGRPVTNDHLLPTNKQKIKKENIKQEESSTDEDELKPNLSSESDDEKPIIKPNSPLNQPSTSKAVLNRRTLFNSDEEDEDSSNIYIPATKRIKSITNLILPTKIEELTPEQPNIYENDPKTNVSQNDSPSINLSTQDLIDII